jgi:hypothetical protein
MPDFWTQLSQNAEFKSVVPQLQLTLQLSAFTLNNTPMVAALQCVKSSCGAYRPSMSQAESESLH